MTKDLIRYAQNRPSIPGFGRAEPGGDAKIGAATLAPRCKDGWRNGLPLRAIRLGNAGRLAR